VRIDAPLLECTGQIKDLCDSSGATMESMRTTYNGHTHKLANAGQPPAQEM
jgi:hypothetical protein